MIPTRHHQQMRKEMQMERIKFSAAETAFHLCPYDKPGLYFAATIESDAIVDNACNYFREIGLMIKK